MVIRAHMGRIAEENVGFFPLRKSPDFGVFLFKPLLHQRFVVFQRTMQRLLAGDTKLRQKPTDSVEASGIVRLHDSCGSYSLRPVKGSLPTYEQINSPASIIELIFKIWRAY
jgi:hypothetical protein